MPKASCPRDGCGGMLFTERYNVPCRECKRSGATVCGACWVETETRCHLCGRGPGATMVRRRDLGQHADSHQRIATSPAQRTADVAY